MDVQRPEGSSPTHTLPSLSGGDNERGSEEKGKEIHRGGAFFFQGNHKELDFQHLESAKFVVMTCHIKEIQSIFLFFFATLCFEYHV